MVGEIDGEVVGIFEGWLEGWRWEVVVRGAGARWW